MNISNVLTFNGVSNRHESEKMKVLCADSDGIVRIGTVALLVLKLSAKRGK
jgi:hypothetical protein